MCSNRSEYSCPPGSNGYTLELEIDMERPSEPSDFEGNNQDTQYAYYILPFNTLYYVTLHGTNILSA